MIKKYTLDQELKGMSILLFYIENDATSVLAENALNNLLDKFQSVNFYKTDIAEDTKVADKYSVYSVPKIILLNNEVVQDSILGLASIEVIKQFIQNNGGV